MENSAIYEDAVDRIQKVYASCSALEQKQLIQILEEISIYGYSNVLENIWLTDFKEIPVSIDTFICSPEYLGNVNRQGEAVYPFWKETLRDIFNNGNKYNEIILSGATRIGKTSTAVIIASYMLYRLMLYRNPHEYFKKKQVSKFTIAFANLTKELAEGVAFREFNDTLKESPFFNEHGRFSRSERNFYYIPEGDKIDIVAASDAAHLLGMQTWHCLVGDTKILTSDGCCTLEEACNSYQEIVQIDNHGKLINCTAPVVLTKYVSDTIRITLEDGSVIEGTPEHRVLLTNGSYKTLGELTEDDDILVFNISEVDCQVIRSKLLKISKIEKIHHENPIPVYDIINAGDHNNFAIMSGESIMIAHNCTMDETNFAKAGVKDISIAKAHMKNLYDTVNARISGTFRIGGEVYGKLVASSSKNSDSDFLSDHIEKQLNAGNQHLYLVDRPQWEILPKSMFSDEVFHFTVGDRYRKGFVIPEENDDEAHRKEYEEQGYTVVEAPAELRKNFLADYDISLRDIAGISVTGAMGFITQELLTACISQDRVNPFFEDVLEIGKNSGSIEISDFFHLEVVPNDLKYQRMNIHLDMAETSDKSGISGTCVSGNKVIEMEDGKKVTMPYLKNVFSVGIKAPRGDRQSFQKIVNFIIWLRRQGFNIGTISADQYQSSYVLETLEQQGFETSKVSVDRSMEPYIGLKNLIIDQRIDIPKNMLLEDELVNLKRLNKKFDHDPDKSKDIADSLAGSCWTLITEKATARPPARSTAAIALAVNTGKATSNRDMSSSRTVRPAGRTRFPRV